jgi:hypothetical protein
MIKLGGKWYKRNTSYFDVNKNCHDCDIANKRGNIHHIGCDMEKCPKCRGQLLSCGCAGDEFVVGGNNIGGMGMGGGLGMGMGMSKSLGMQSNWRKKLGL